MSRQVVVIGAGPSGLSAAWAATEAGHRVTVLEAQPGPGGLSGSFDFAGFQVDYGPHRLHLAASPEVMQLYLAAVGGALRVRKRSGLLHVDGGKLPYPLSLIGAVRGLGLTKLLQLSASAAWARVRPPGGHDYGAEAARRLGRRAARILYEPAARKVWGLAPSELDDSLGRARVQKSGPWAVLQSALGRSGSASGRRYFYPGGGFGALCDGLSARLGERGVALRFGARVSGLAIESGRVAGVKVGDEVIEADAVVATTPLPELCAWAGSPEAAEGLSYRALVLLYLELDTPRASTHDVHYFAGEDVPANRIFEARNFSGRQDGGRRTVIGLDLPCAQGDATWRADADALVERTRPALARVGLSKVPIRSAKVRRMETAYPLYRRGVDVARGRALEALSAVEGLYPVGRQALFVHDNVHHACAAGLAAGHAAAGAWSSRAWRTRASTFLHAQIED